MAAYYGQAIERSPLSRGSQFDHLLLPNGGCSYRDLTGGAKAPSCGCRRFWLNKSHVIAQESERAWCFCGHHACFHENVLPAGPNLSNHQAAGLTAHTLYDAQQVPDAEGNQPGAFVAPTWSSLIRDHDQDRSEPERPGTARPTTGLGIRNTSQPQADSIGNRLWHALNGFARQQEAGGNSGDTSKLPSTAVPSLYDEPGRASPRPMLQRHAQANRSMRPPVSIPPINITETRAEEYSATEVATPSVRGTPDFRATTTLGAQANLLQMQNLGSQTNLDVEQQRLSRQNDELSRTTENVAPPTETMGPSLSIQEMCNTIQDYGRRLSILEGVSFSHMPSEEVQQAFDLQDGRLIDLESWRREQDEAEAADDTGERLDEAGKRLDELESWRHEQDRSKTSQESDGPPQPASKKRQLLSDTSSIASDGSFDEDAAAQTEAVVLATLAANAETGPRIDALESRISLLENCSMPSVARPWHVSVVVLPWGRQLPGIWFSALESTQHSTRSAVSAAEDWSGHHSALKGSFMSAASSGAWTTESIEAWAKETEDEWLSPKACGPSGTVFQRLASRGLVRDVVLHSPHANHILETISKTFANVIRSSSDENMAEADLVGKYQGLRERFIPLRKVRKSSRLRFLTPAEMMTSAAWTAEFLESSVFMKVNDGERRLYVTTSDGYMQPARLGWSWPELRSLPAFDVDGFVQEAQVDGTIVEACWTYNDRLDHAESSNSSFASTGGEIEWHADDGQEIDNQDELMLSPTATRSRGRSASLPSSAIEKEAVPVTKRRVASFELEPTSSLTYSPEYMTKRRRISNSPELERRGVNFTPRWSREPPSPYLTDDLGLVRSSQATNRPRGTTPFAYATPHSHFDSRGGDGDTEVDDVMTAPANVSDDEDDAEEWEGVQDEEESYRERLAKKPSTGVQTYDQNYGYEHEHNLEDGLRIDEV